MSQLEADVADAFARHRRRLAVAGIASADLNAVEALARMLVRLHDNARLQPTMGGVDDEEAHTVPMSLLVDFEDVARELHVSRRTVERLARTGRLPTVSVGPQAVRVRRCDLDAFVQGLEVRSMAHADAEIRAEFATAGRQEMTLAEKARLESVVAELSEAAQHRGDPGTVAVRWQRSGIEEPLERRFATVADAERFAADLSANPEPGRMLQLNIDDGAGVSSGPAVDPAALRRAQLERKRH